MHNQLNALSHTFRLISAHVVHICVFCRRVTNQCTETVMELNITGKGFTSEKAAAGKKYLGDEMYEMAAQTLLKDEIVSEQLTRYFRISS